MASKPCERIPPIGQPFTGALLVCCTAPWPGDLGPGDLGSGGVSLCLLAPEASRSVSWPRRRLALFLGPGRAEASSHGWSEAEPVVPVGPHPVPPRRGGRSHSSHKSDSNTAILPPPLPGRVWGHPPYSTGSAALHPWLHSLTPSGSISEKSVDGYPTGRPARDEPARWVDSTGEKPVPQVSSRAVVDSWMRSSLSY